MQSSEKLNRFPLDNKLEILEFFLCQGNGRGRRLDYSPDDHSPDLSPALPILRWSSPCSFWLRLAALGIPAAKPGPQKNSKKTVDKN
jgi:hypothetical protein